MTFVLIPVLGLTLTVIDVADVVGGTIGLMTLTPPTPLSIGFLFTIESPSFLIAIILTWPILLLLAILIFADPLLLDLSFFGEGIDLR